jgi:hypothetical protein
MADNELDDDERALLEQHRAKKKKAAESDKEVWIRQGEDEAAIPYSKARTWLQAKFGIDLDDEPTQDAPDAAPGQTESAQQSAAVRRFAGRRDTA